MRTARPRCCNSWRGVIAALGTAALLASAAASGTSHETQNGGDIDSTVFEFGIPAQPLAEALQAFARQLRQQVSFDSSALARSRSQAVVGRFTAEQALQRMLEGSGVVYRRGEQGVWLVGRPRTGTSPAPAKSVASASRNNTKAGIDVPGERGVDTHLRETQFVEALVVSASRTPQHLDRVSSSVTAIPIREMGVQQIDTLQGALAQQAGVTVVRTGAVGGGTSVFVRGAYPHHTLFIVDGVRVNDRSASYDAFIGGADLAGIDRIEILRGPQSPMYGSAAMGGVVLMNTAGPGDEPDAALKLHAGSFGTYAAAGSVRGRVGDLGYSAAVTRLHTDNDESSNGFDSWNYSSRLDYELTPNLDIGITIRGQQADYESPGSRLLHPAGIADTSNTLGTLYANWQVVDAMTLRFVAGLHQREYRWSGDDGASDQTNKRRILDWQGAWRPSDALEVVGGINYEDSIYEISGERTDDGIFAAFLSGTLRFGDALTLNAGIRNDDFDSVGSAFTWRAGAAWVVHPQMKLRATYGTGFAAPGSADRYGVPAWGQLPSPDLRPEKSRGWDIGIDRSFAPAEFTFSATLFENHFEDLIDWQYRDASTVEGSYANRGRARTRGAELGISAQPLSGWHARVGYTYLESEDRDTGRPLPRRPRHSLNASTWIELTQRWTAGLGVRLHTDRVEGSQAVEDYTVARVFTSLHLSQRLAVKARIENLFDEQYDEVFGYPALPRGVYGSVEWQF